MVDGNSDDNGVDDGSGIVGADGSSDSDGWKAVGAACAYSTVQYGTGSQTYNHQATTHLVRKMDFHHAYLGLVRKRTD
jgi:hypothetical protein